MPSNTVDQHCFSYLISEQKGWTDFSEWTNGKAPSVASPYVKFKERQLLMSLDPAPAKPASTGWTFDKILLNPGYALAELALLNAERHVPGQWHCDSCSFGLYQRTLHAADGTVSARDEEGEVCPNCKTTLRRVTWRERADQAEEMLEQAIDERNKALASGTPAVNDFVRKVAQVATEVGFQAGEPAMELAGQIVSVLAVNTEQTDRFLAEGGELLIDGTFNAENGSLTYRTADGRILHPSVLREKLGRQQ